MARCVLIVVIAVVTVTALAGAYRTWRHKRYTPTVGTKADRRRDQTTLFVLVPGARQQVKGLTAMETVLAPLGSVMQIRYPECPWTNADPLLLSKDIARQIDAEWQKFPATQRPHIILVGHSLGALLARQAFLEGRRADWGQAVSRIVLLAGMNRGWDISGRKPADMEWWTYLKFAVGAWVGRLSWTGQLMLDAEAGAPFVSNLRLEWLKAFREQGYVGPELVQLLGDIDDIVSAQDNQDLYAVSSSRFVWFRVRGTGHESIVDMAESAGPSGGAADQLRQYRAKKLKFGVEASFSDLLAANEDQPFTTDPAVSHLVFVLHGIRDLGEWSSQFEEALRTHLPPAPVGQPPYKLAVHSARYGYFGMGPFLFQFERDKYVRWFMDTYTETLARYPNVRYIHFVGHSNGTYLLGDALRDYHEMSMHRIVFGGSVTRSDYDWPSLIGEHRIVSIRNYVASGDWVVALFPRFFERPPMRWLGNDIGSAGFTGLKAGNPLPWRGTAPASLPLNTEGVTNVGYLPGGHAAFLEKTDEIAQFLLRPLPTDEAVGSPQQTAAAADISLTPKPSWSPWRFADWSPSLVWALLCGIVLLVGARVAVAGHEFAWAALIAYVALVAAVLWKV